MNSINKVHRRGVDIGVAFSSGAKRQLVNLTVPVDVAASRACIQENRPDTEYPQATLNKRMWILSRINFFVRQITCMAYRLAFIASRPILIRLRQYFVDGFREDILPEFQRVAVRTLQEVQAVQAAQASLKQDLLNTHELTLQEFQKVSASTLGQVRAMQAAQESLKQDLLNTHELTLQEFQKVSASTLGQVQALLPTLAPRLDRIELYSGASARRIAISCEQGEVMVRTEVGFILCAATDYALLACLIETGELELGTRLLIQRFLRPGEVFIDVGANIGMHTLAAARALQGRGKIIAFEPFEPTKRLLEKSVWMNGFSAITEIHQAAVSNHTGHQQLFLGETSGHHSLYPLSTHKEFSSTPVDVVVVRLDKVIPVGQKVDLIKIDAEGAELEVIESGASLINGNPDIALIVEFGPFHLNRTGHTTQQWLKTFSKLKLSHRVINSYTGALEDWSLEQLEQTDSVNLFFARAGSPAWSKLPA